MNTNLHENARLMGRRYGWSMAFVVILLAIAVKVVYLLTAESTVDIEELPMAALNVVLHAKGAVAFDETRLYGVNYITNAIFLWIFGFHIVSLKLTSLFFFIVASIWLFLTSRFWNKDSGSFIKWLPVILIAFGPPVAQMWALKNRGGFIESWAGLSIVLYLYTRWHKDQGQRHLLYLMGIVSGISAWAQPIALTFILPVALGVLWSASRTNIQASVKAGLDYGSSLAVGSMPLVALNFLYRFNTFNVLDAGEYGQGAVHWWQRFTRLFSQGFPRLIGLKQQWTDAWLFPEWLSVIILVFVLGIVFLAVASVLSRFLKERDFSPRMLAVTVILCVIAANTFSSWGAFQLEPRRLLLLYVPVMLLVIWFIKSSKKILWAFVLAWLSVSLYSNVRYVSQNLHGFNNPFYASYKEEANFLVGNGINRVYVNIWEGAKLTFDSKMRVSWSSNPYMPSSTGFKSSGHFDDASAVAFYKRQPGYKKALISFRDDLHMMGISCVVKDAHNFITYYACSKVFNLYTLHAQAEFLRKSSAEGVFFDYRLYPRNLFHGVYAPEKNYAWTRQSFDIPIYQPKAASGYLCILAGSARVIDPQNFHVTVDGQSLPMRAWKSDTKAYVSFAPLALIMGWHEFSLRVPGWQPSAHGGHDRRWLGIPLQQVSIADQASMCAPKKQQVKQ